MVLVPGVQAEVVPSTEAKMKDLAEELARRYFNIYSNDFDLLTVGFRFMAEFMDAVADRRCAEEDAALKEARSRDWGDL